MKEEELPDKQNIKLLLKDRQERLKELACINRTTAILKEGKTIEESLHQIALLLPSAWQYPEFTVSRIIFEEKEYKSPGFRITPWVQSQDFTTIDDHEGVVEVYYTKEFAVMDEGPFLKEERNLINNICSLLSGYINSFKAKTILFRVKKKESQQKQYTDDQAKVLNSRQLLQRFLNKNNAERDLFHDLMPFKVKEILLVATLYDAYNIEKEGRFSDHMLGQFQSLNLSSLPRVTGVSKLEEAVDELQKKHYDLVIVMMGVDKRTPLVLSRKLKEEYPYIPIFFLLNNNRDAEFYEEGSRRYDFIDRLFVWYGDSKMFFAMIKILEDHVNVDNDTALGFTKVILLVEDSPKYYSRYLPMIYSIVLEQTKHLIEDVNTDELYKELKLRGRPKILLASTYEEAIDIFNRYRDFLLCVISDVRFPRNGKTDPTAGVDLIRHIKSQIGNMPALLQSADTENQSIAHELHATFINKNSETLLQDLKSFITYYLGFGHFVYRDREGRQIAVAKSMSEFESYLKTVPEESLVYHTVKNHFSLWLMARGEVKIARRINPVKVTDFETPSEMRDFLVNIISTHRNEQDRGRIINFETSAILEESNIVSFAPGSLGGKGRGLAFVNSLIYNFRFSELLSGINIRTPVTGIIGTEEFDIFLEINKLHDKIYREENYERIRQMFIGGKLSYNLEKKMKIFLRQVKRPIAIRSSSMFEDSLMQPFSGIFETYLLPNNHPVFDIRLQQAMDAIKLVYASIFSESARKYFESIDFKIEEEKMAIVIQEVVGNPYDSCYYPNISGTAQSHNYYPVAHMKTDEGFSVAALGLGRYVVEGEKSYRFSPKYPGLEINSTADIYKNSQVEFYAVNLAKPEINILEGEEAGLIKLSISEAEKHGNLKHCASVYDIENDVITPGLDKAGPRVINFANILKYEYIPLARTLNIILDVVKEALGCPVEIEFAVDLERDRNNLPSFYLLQIKPLFGNESDYNIDEERVNKNSILIRSGRSMGNGMINNLGDVIYIKPETFDKMKTREMAVEIDRINSGMLKSGRKYILIGPGRWGTRDRFIGIPVSWPQISNAAVIVEMSMEGFPLDASLGSHFFHNLTSMNVGYFSVNHTSPDDIIRTGILAEADLVEETGFVRHVRFSSPLQVLMDGKKGLALILKQE
jgi:CheY-like chemotaxis protein